MAFGIDKIIRQNGSITMASTQEILSKADEIGKMVGEHETSKRLEAAMKLLQNDLESQRMLSDFNRTLQALAQKEAAGKPIEVEDKRKLETLQSHIVRNPTLRQFQTAQMDYLDLLRKIDERINGTPAEGAGAAAGGAGVGAGAGAGGVFPGGLTL